MRNTHLLVCTISVLLLIACERAPEKFSYRDSLLISVHSGINDSILTDKSFQCFAYLDMNDTEQIWKKHLFVWENKKLSESIPVIFDTCTIVLTVDQGFQIKDFKNWKRFFKDYTYKVEKVIESYPPEERPLVAAFIRGTAFDSLLIVSKHLKEIELFNRGLVFVKNPEKVKKGTKIKVKEKIIELTGTETIAQENLDYALKSLTEHLPLELEEQESKAPKPTLHYLIQIDHAHNRIIYAEQTISVCSGQDTLKQIIRIMQK